MHDYDVSKFTRCNNCGGLEEEDVAVVTVDGSVCRVCAALYAPDGHGALRKKENTMTFKQRIQQYLDLRDTEQLPTSGDFRNGARAEGFWFEDYNGRLARYEQVAGSSGVYLIVTALDTGEVLRDDRPWQMTV